MRRLVIWVVLALAGCVTAVHSEPRVLVPLSDMRTTAAIYDLSPEIAGKPATYTMESDPRLYVVVVNCKDPHAGQRALGILPYRYVTAGTLDKVEARAFNDLVPECSMDDK